MSRINAEVPRTPSHLLWRLVLFMRYLTPLVSRAKRTHLTWNQRAEILLQGKTETMRKMVLRRQDFQLTGVEPVIRDRSALAVTVGKIGIEGETAFSTAKQH